MSVDREALRRIRASLGSLAETVYRAQFAAAQLEHTLWLSDPKNDHAAMVRDRYVGRLAAVAGNFNEAIHDLRGALEDDQSLERLREWEASS